MEVVNRLRAGVENAVVLIEANGTSQLTPFDPAFQEQMKKAEEIMFRYRDMLNVLAK